MVLSDLLKRNETEGNLMVWFNFEAGLVVLMRENLKTYGFIDEKLHMVKSNQSKQKRNWRKFDGVV